MNRATIYQAFLFLLAVIAFAELAFSNVFTLLTDLEGTAEQFGLSVGAERIRLLILIVLDGIAGSGAAIALLGYRRGNVTLFSRGLSLTLGGFLAYGTYQVAAAWLQLAAEYQMPVTAAGITYAVLGFVAFVAGRSVLTNGDFAASG